MVLLQGKFRAISLQTHSHLLQCGHKRAFLCSRRHSFPSRNGFATGLPRASIEAELQVRAC